MISSFVCLFLARGGWKASDLMFEVVISILRGFKQRQKSLARISGEGIGPYAH